MKESFEIIQHTTLWEFYKLALYFSYKNKKFRQFYFIILFVSVVSAILGFVSGDGSDLAETILAVAIAILVPVVFFVLGTLIITVILHLVRPAVFKASFQFDHWGMHKRTGSQEITRPWRAFVKWKETKEIFLLFIGEQDAHFISKRVLGESDVPAFRSLLQERIGEEATK